MAVVGLLVAEWVATLAATSGRGVARAAGDWRGEQAVAALQKRRLSLDGVTVKGSLDLRSLDTVEHPFSCRNCAIEGRGIAMDVGDALSVITPESLPHVLRLIESGAKSDGDLGVANDARYSLEVIESREEPWCRRVPNVVFYRRAAGYFVRPFDPIAVLLLLAGAASLARVMRLRPASSSLAHGAWVRLNDYGLELGSLLALIGRRSGDEGPGLEAFVYRALVVCALIGLGNSNPTLREMFDALV